MSKVILITGASSGFGKMAALALIRLGNTVYGAARRVEQMKELEDAGGHALKMDVTDEASIKIGVETIIQKQGKIDVLVNNAGYAAYGFIESTDITHAKKQFDVNLWGLISCTQAVLPYMRKERSGTIINISSVVGKVTMPLFGFYSASKHAVEAISDATRQEIKSFGIKLAIIQPGGFNTGFGDVAFEELEHINAKPEYEENLDNFKRYLKDFFDKSPTPEPVVKAIVHAVNSKEPKTRYKVGKDAKAALIAKNLLPDKQFDSIITSKMNQK